MALRQTSPPWVKLSVAACPLVLSAASAKSWKKSHRWGLVYQAGTLSGNPVAMAAGMAALDIISQPGFYEPLFKRTEQLAEGLVAAAKEAGIPLTANYVGSMFGVFFTEAEKVSNYTQVMDCDTERFNRFFHGMLDAGIYLAPASYEAGFFIFRSYG